MLGIIMPFGKHKGKFISELPSSYLHWLAENCENEEVCSAQMRNIGIVLIITDIGMSKPARHSSIHHPVRCNCGAVYCSRFYALLCQQNGHPNRNQQQKKENTHAHTNKTSR